jgi:outer membrane scaffolding protein for murein synthesis (MipA/OmpV family)
MANGLSLYEFGVGAGTFNSPHYPGSNQRQVRYLALPMFKYRGKVLKTDKGGMRAEFLKSNWYIMDLSFSAAFPANSKDNDARKDMPDLDWIGEIGPRFKIHLLKNYNRYHNLDLNLQLRSVISTDFISTSYVGNVFHPVLSYKKRNFIFNRISFGIRFGSIWADELMMDYFYEVDPTYMTSNRKQYNAKAGLIEQHLDFSLSFNITKRLNIFSFIQNNFYAHATNKNSPLHLSEKTQTYALGISWTFFESEAKAL